MNKKYDHKEIIAYYLEGNNQIETAKYFGTSNQYVGIILKNNNIEIRPVDRCGENNPNWKGGEINDGHGRKLIYCPEHPNPSMFGTHVYEYRLIMEKILGRHLTKDEIVHHINGDHTDNRPENLEVTIQSKHASGHHLKYNYNAIVEYYLLGYSDSETAAYFGCSTSTVGTALIENNVQIHSKRKYDYNKIKEYHLSGMSAKDISEKFNMCYTHACDIINKKKWDGVTDE